MEQPVHESRRIDPRPVRSAAVDIVRRDTQGSSQRGARKQRTGGAQTGRKSGGGRAQVAGTEGQAPDFAEKWRARLDYSALRASPLRGRPKGAFNSARRPN